MIKIIDDFLGSISECWLQRRTIRGYDVVGLRQVIIYHVIGVLSWLKRDTRKFKPFVARRISETLCLTEPDNSYWVPTGNNVADEGTKERIKATGVNQTDV